MVARHVGRARLQLEKLAADFNASQSDYRIVPTYKGNYTETVTAAIFAFRSRSQPAIVQVNEIATATMMAAKGAIYPVFELMRDEPEAFSPAAYLPAVTGYYTDVAGNMLSFPFNASTPILYYNKDLFRAAGLDPGGGAEDLAGGRRGGEAAARRRRALRLHHVLAVMDQCREFFRIPQSADRDQGQWLRRARRGADFQQSGDGAPHRATRGMADRRRSSTTAAAATAAEPRFQKGECAIFIGSSATRADIKANSKFEVGYGMLPYWPDVAGAPQNTIIGGATLWVLRDRPRDEYTRRRANSSPICRSRRSRPPGTRTPAICRSPARPIDLTRAQGFYDRNPGTAISIEQITLKPPTENSKGVRLGSFVLIRDVIDDELEQAFSGKKSAQAALDAGRRARQPAAAPVRARQSLTPEARSGATEAAWRSGTDNRELVGDAVASRTMRSQSISGRPAKPQ